ncbi:MAG: ATP-binding protein [Breznakibacter sp.]
MKMGDKADLYVLMLEDDPLDAELNKAQLRLLDDYNCHITLVTDKASYLHALGARVPDIVLSDYDLPQYSGLDALRDLRERELLVPFIFVTGAMNEETAAETIKAGAWDYVVKDRLLRLPLAIRGALQLKGEKLNTQYSEEKNLILSSALAQSPVHVIISNTNGQIEYVNQSFCDVTGFSGEEVLGRDPQTLAASSYGDAFWTALWQQLQSGQTWRGEMESLKKDGTLFWESVNISPLKNPAGKITHFISIREDITHRKKIEQQLAEARDRAERSDKLKEAFLQNLSHEIRTPMNAIVGFSGLLTEPGLDNVTKSEYAKIVQNSCSQLLAIVTDILTIARIQTGQERIISRPVFVNEMLDNLVAMLKPKAREKKLDLILHRIPDNPMPVIITDETKLSQVLTNLLQNALKFTIQGSVEIGYKIEDGRIEFFVKDSGIGISKEALCVIFERFRQADPSVSVEFGGTGLGLSISKSYATMLGGDIRVESEPGKGSVFYVSIPSQI